MGSCLFGVSFYNRQFLPALEREGHLIISHQHNFIFICNPKTGTTSLEHALEGCDDGLEGLPAVSGAKMGKHIAPAALKEILPLDEWNAYFKFVFVRNPFDWVVSQLRSNHKKPRYRFEKVLRGRVSPWNEWNGYRTRTHIAECEVYGREAVDYIFQVLQRWRPFDDATGLYQRDYLFDAAGTKMVDFVGRFEYFSDDLEQVKSRIGLDFELPHLNASTRKPYMESLTSEAEQRRRELWAVDFRDLGY